MFVETNSKTKQDTHAKEDLSSINNNMTGIRTEKKGLNCMANILFKLLALNQIQISLF